jgi:hypothetical protein
MKFSSSGRLGLNALMRQCIRSTTDTQNIILLPEHGSGNAQGKKDLQTGDSQSDV